MSRQCPKCGAVNVPGKTKICPICGEFLDLTTVILTDVQAVDDGATKTIPEPEPVVDDGTTKAMPESDDGATKGMPDPGIVLDDGATKAVGFSQQKKTVKRPGTDTDLKIGQVLQQRYRLDKILGKGGFGAVYLAQDKKLKRVCVVKQMLPLPVRSAQDIDLYRINFEREADLLVQLNHPGHPNIPEIYDYFSDAGGNYLVMKYIEGRSLKDALERSEGKIPWREAVRYAVDVCDALNYMHTVGKEPVMHRDIKPANILLGDDGRVWLADFGLAKANPVEGGGGLDSTRAAGSVGYTPLEQWLGEAKPTSDIYALGATLHYLISGLDPVAAFDGDINIQKLQELHGQFISLSKVDRSLPRELDGIVARATITDPSRRPTALQFKQQLEAMISGTQEVGLFTFKSGESAKTSGQLVDLCQKYNIEAQEYLYHGDFERWFVIINRYDLAEAASQAVKQGKNQKDGLEKFLKLMVPNLFLRRLGKATRRLALVTAQIFLIALIILLFVVVGGSYVAGWFIQQSIGGYAWNYNALELDKDNYFTEQFLTDKFKEATRSYLDDIRVEVHTPDRLEIWADWAGVPLRLPVTLRLENQKPRFYVDEINEVPLFLIAENISAGINRGIDQAFARAPVDITNLYVGDGVVVFSTGLSGRTPFVTPTPIIIPVIAPTVTPTPVSLTMVAIFNELDQDVTLKIEDETWHILAGDSKVIEKEPGVYQYSVRYTDTGQLAAQGLKSWGRKVYRWHISLLDAP